MSEKMMSQNKLSEFELVPYNKPLFFCLSILNVLLLYLTSNYFTFCLPPLVLPHLFLIESLIAFKN
jgi:hypothetical protein